MKYKKMKININRKEGKQIIDMYATDTRLLVDLFQMRVVLNGF